jgi:hypothetical protein
LGDHPFLPGQLRQGRPRVDPDPHGELQHLQSEGLCKVEAFLHRFPRLSRAAEEEKSYPADADIPLDLRGPPHLLRGVLLDEVREDGGRAAFEPEARLDAAGLRHQPRQPRVHKPGVEDAAPADGETRRGERCAELLRVLRREVEGIVDEVEPVEAGRHVPADPRHHRSHRSHRSHRVLPDRCSFEGGSGAEAAFRMLGFPLYHVNSCSTVSDA